MENEKILILQLRLTRKNALVLLTALFICWRPGFLGSETMTMTTYYPAPYGGYASLLTTGTTLLARDAGGVVGIGMPSAATPITVRNVVNYSIGVKLDVNGYQRVSGGLIWGWNAAQQSGGMLNIDQGGSIELGKGGGSPYIDFSQNASQDYSARIMLDQAGRLRIAPDLYVERDLTVGGRIINLCRYKPYIWGSITGCDSPNERIFGWFGDGVVRAEGMLMGSGGAAFGGTWIGIGQDWAGRMQCCRIN